MKNGSCICKEILGYNLSKPEEMKKIQEEKLSGLRAQVTELNTEMKGILKEEDLPKLAKSAFADVCTPGNPREVTEEIILDLYKKVL